GDSTSERLEKSSGTALAMASMALLKCMDLPVSVYLTGKGLMISLLKVGLTDWHYANSAGFFASRLPCGERFHVKHLKV
ncbi:hypothetical protein, partial [Halomonas salinarum]|uniref:hypothetical protein n=1 Tax=Halomonas salinarum TaxID=1158993 RepID=UPI001ADE254C